MLRKIILYIKKPFIEHPNSVGESYIEHMLESMRISAMCAYISVVFIVHSIFPFLFKRTGCIVVGKINNACNRKRDM